MDYKKAIEDFKTENGALHGRMDDDRKLVELNRYILQDVNGKNVPNSISVTLNDMAVFAASVESSLGSATEQVVVETDSKQLDTAYIEEFVKAVLKDANSRLVRADKFPLNPFINQQMTRRGRGSVRCAVRVDKEGHLIADIVPWDSRYVFHKMGKEGLEWVAYETTRTKGRIRAEYPKAEISGSDSDEGVLWDIYGKEKNEIWVDELFVFEQKHPYGYVPVVHQIVPMGSMMADKESQGSKGESIFFLIRDLVPELNRLVSIIQSLNQKALDNAMLWKSQDGTTATPPSHKDLTTPGKVTAADIGGGSEPVAYGELRRSAYLLHSMIETRIQRGSVSNVDLGIMGNQPWSAVALLQIGEGRNEVFLPRLGASGLLKQQFVEMAIEQTIQSEASSVEVGPRGHKRSFDVSKLKGEYEITFKYFIKSPNIDVARFSMAASAGPLVSDKFKTEHILQMEDPEGDNRQKRWEEAERLSPAIKMNRTIRNLIEMAKRGDKDAELEAEMLSAEMGMNLKQMMSGDTQQVPKPEEAAEPTPMIPMFGGGSARRATQLQAEPGESEGEE